MVNVAALCLVLHLFPHNSIAKRHILITPREQVKVYWEARKPKQGLVASVPKIFMGDLRASVPHNSIQFNRPDPQLN
jgi:hypothetical protein